MYLQLLCDTIDVGIKYTKNVKRYSSRHFFFVYSENEGDV